MNRFDESIVVMRSSAILMRISQLCGDEGMSFDRARQKALKEVSLADLTYEQATKIRTLVSTYTAVDIAPADMLSMKDRVYAEYVNQSLIKDHWLNRLLWRLFSVTW